MVSLQLFGIKIEFHASYFLLLALLGLCGNWLLALVSTGFSFLHELAHGFVAKRLGYTPQKISAGLFGGILHLRENVISPKDQLLIHLAGPFFNVFMALIGFLIYRVFPFSWILELIISNLMLGFFNLMPFYPLDGGKLSNLYLAFLFGFRKAEQVSHFFSRLFSVFLLFVVFVCDVFV